MDAVFRRAAVGDAELLVTFMREFYAEDHLSFDETAARRALAEILADERCGSVWVIDCGAEPAGYLVLTLGFSLEFHGRDAFVDEVYVRPAFRRHGIGRRALDVAMEQCRAAGVQALHLEVGHANARARVLYERSGFRAHDRYLMTHWI